MYKIGKKITREIELNSHISLKLKKFLKYTTIIGKNITPSIPPKFPKDIALPLSLPKYLVNEVIPA